MRIGTLVRLALLACAAALAILGAAPAQAASSTTSSATTSQAQVVGLVLRSANPTAAFDSLTVNQRALFLESQQHLSATTVVSFGGPLGSTTSKPAGPLAVTPNANGCWYWYLYTTWDNFGYTEGDTWTQLNWCGSGGRITSHSLSNVGGKSDDVFFTYNGVVGEPGGLYSVSGHQEWRQVVEYQFTVHVPGFSGTANPCQQTRGGSTGLVSTNYSCNLEA